MTKTYIALYQYQTNDLPRTLEDCTKNNYDAVVTSIVHPLFWREFEQQPIKEQHFAFSRSDLIVPSEEWLYKIIALATDTIDCDSDDINIRRHSEETLKQEILFAEHLMQTGHMVFKIKSLNTTNLAQIISKASKGSFLAHIPIIDPKVGRQTWRSDLNEDQLTEGEDTWNWWNRFRMVADFSPKIKVALELSEDFITKKQIQRWLGEPVDCLIIPSKLFKQNKNNYPVLPSGLLAIIREFLRNKCNFIIKSSVKDEGIRLYSEYLRHIAEQFYIVDPMEGLDDILEIPLQPLFDNLDCYTYEVFERDPVKYQYYQKAIELALTDTVPDREIENRTVILMVVGAGRGPLVRAALNASTVTKRKIKIYIIEKNPHAVITLTALVEELWPDQDIEIFSKDMREFKAPEKADILVSELLGSLGDNELSPECLDGAQKLLKPNGICIPCEYSSYINPVMSSKIYNSVRSIVVDRFSIFRDKLPTPSTFSESVYVVYMKNVYHIDQPQKLFEFYHPNYSKVIDNSRFKILRFTAEQDCVLHGLAGYFDAVLYKNITLSIHPVEHTKGLFSWFSCYIPISEPQFVRAGETIEVNFWRCINSQKVWYEWCITSPNISHIHNRNGQSCPIYK